MSDRIKAYINEQRQASAASKEEQKMSDNQGGQI
jgi:hypothetical protein